jgi:hypothetical protein
LPIGGRLTVQNVGDALRWAQALAAVSSGAPGARGLARHQTAERVLQTARFLESRQEPDNQDAPRGWSATSAPGSVCQRCLLPLGCRTSGAGSVQTSA